MAVKIIALDLDGKALNMKNKMTGSTEKTLMDAARMGIEIVPVTGRCYRALPEDLLKYDSGECIRYAVTSNGAEIRDVKKGIVLYGDYLRPEAAAEIKRVLFKLDVMVEVYVNGKAYIEKKFFEKVRNGSISYRDRDYVMNTRVPVRGVMQLFDVHRSRIEKVAVYYGSDVVKRGVEEALRTVDHVNISASESSCIELVAENCSKARTLEVLCGKLDITPAERLSMGAGENDFEQISAFFQYQQCQ